MDDAPGDRDLGRGYWDGRWAQALREHGDAVALMPPNPLLTETAGPLAPGRALDAGCGHGSEALWLAGHGWQVTALDFSATVLDHCRSTAAALGPDIAAQVDWWLTEEFAPIVALKFVDAIEIGRRRGTRRTLPDRGRPVSVGKVRLLFV